jgi:hypothetical protein
MKPTIRDYAREALPIFIWVGFGFPALLASKPLWSYLIRLQSYPRRSSLNPVLLR